MLKSKNNRGQTAETVTWLVATIVIIGILILFIYISTLMSQTKKINLSEIKTDLPRESSILEGKTILSHVIMNNKNKEAIDEVLRNENG